MKSTLAIIALCLTIAAGAQQKDSTALMRDTSMLKPGFPINHTVEKMYDRRKKIKSLIIPAALITYGFVSLQNEQLQAFDNLIKNEIRENNPLFHTKIDDYLQYVPAAAVYGLNAMGIKGKNNLRDRSIIYLLANAIMGVTVQSLKAITKVPRPDGFGTNAFPSGHTATAFVSAEFLYQEYKDISPWYGIAGYLAATSTGILRIYNNRHWFRDILPGAGFGILSTKVAYWLYPAIKRTFFKDKSMKTIVLPYYQNGGGGLSLVCNL